MHQKLQEPVPTAELQTTRGARERAEEKLFVEELGTKEVRVEKREVPSKEAPITPVSLWAGHLSYFSDRWESITSDPRFLDWIKGSEILFKKKVT